MYIATGQLSLTILGGESEILEGRESPPSPPNSPRINTEQQTVSYTYHLTNHNAKPASSSSYIGRENHHYSFDHSQITLKGNLCGNGKECKCMQIIKIKF